LVKRGQRHPVDSIQGAPAFAGVTDGVAHLLKEAKRALAEIGNPTPGLDARLLLQQATGIAHEGLIADPDQGIAPEAVATFHTFLTRRLAGEPVSRILGEREFYGRAFRITEAVLDPRPDTETLIATALTFVRVDEPCRIIDLGTGSGIIGVTLLAERPNALAAMTDISDKALAVARENAERHGVSTRCTFVHGSWFAGAQGRFDLVLSNPPYIAEAILPGLAPEVRNFDPKTALVGGPDGLLAYREIAAGAGPFLAPQGHVIVEIGEGQELEIEDIFRGWGFGSVHRWRDLTGHVRCLGFSHA
jgi:release factor glutamine methyltransferase